MNELFLRIINMSISASWLVPVALLLRLVLKKAPRWVMVLLWGIVAFRLLCPFSVESALSLIPSAETVPLDIELDVSPAIDSGVDSINRVVNPVIAESFTPNPVSSVNPLQIWIGLAAVIWTAGIAAMLLYAVISYRQLRRSVATAVRHRDNIYQSESVASPFVLGILSPRIYLPFQLDGQDLEHVIAHEQAHIGRKDHWWKPLGFLLLAIHWFNPLLWLSYVLLCRDIELACDEKVIRDLGCEQRADYTQALVSCSVNRHSVAACPVAFGEVSVKQRVKSVMNYRKPAVSFVILSIIICLIVGVCFVTNPVSSVNEKLAVFIDCEIASHHQTEKSAEHYCCLDWDVIGKTKAGSRTTVYMWVLYNEFSNGHGLTLETGSHILTAITVDYTNGSYQLVEYWEPRDGSYYVDSIKQKIPFYLWNKAMDSQRYIDAQSAALEQMAKKHFAEEAATAGKQRYYLTIGDEGVAHIEIETPYTSGGGINANGRPYRKGETVWLEPLDGFADLRSVVITALDQEGYQICSIRISDYYDPKDPKMPIICGDWVISTE